MECQVCKEREATTFVKTVVNGQLTAMRLCDQCARERGFGSLFEGFDMGSFLGGIFQDHSGSDLVKRCDRCGASFEDIAKSGKLGCDHCYQVFRGQLRPMLQRIHGSAVYKGKRPGSYALQVADASTKLVAKKEIKPKTQEEKKEGKDGGPQEVLSENQKLIQEKQKALREAIAKQAFEEAAVLRDEIKELESHDR